MIPIGAKVQWHRKMGNRASGWIGVVTGHPRARMVEVDNRTTISEGLLEVVGEMNEHEAVERAYEKALNHELEAVVAERDALRELVVSQAETNAKLAQELAGSSDENLQARIDELQEWVANVQSYTEDVLLLFMGERRPVRSIEPPELRRLSSFVFEGT